MLEEPHQSPFEFCESTGLLASDRTLEATKKTRGIHLYGNITIRSLRNYFSFSVHLLRGRRPPPSGLQRRSRRQHNVNLCPHEGPSAGG